MNLIRSWMFVPGHRQRMIDKALGLNADAIMLDIEDGVAPNEKDAARKNISESLGREKAPGSPARYVRINAIGHARMDADLAVRMNVQTGEFVEYLLPYRTNVRQINVQKSGAFSSMWVGDQHGNTITRVEPLAP